MRLGSVMAAQLSAQAVDLMYDAAGLTAASVDCAIERCWRDVHVARQHITLATTRFKWSGAFISDCPPHRRSLNASRSATKPRAAAMAYMKA